VQLWTDCLFGRVISTTAFRSLFSSIRFLKRTELYQNSSKACFLNQLLHFAKYLIEIAEKVVCKKETSRYTNSWNQLKASYYKNSEYVFRKLQKMLQKLAIIITPEGKANKQQNEAILFFIGNQNFSTDLIFRSQQV